MDKNLEEIFCTSDEYHDITCTPCSKEKRNVSATKYCNECANYLCENCVQQHNRFGAMKGHLIVDKAAAKELPGDQDAGLPVQQCNKHYRKRLDMYCKSHDEVCCGVCAAIDHRTCKEMKYLPYVIKELKDKQNPDDIFRSINHSQMKMAQLKLAKMKQCEIFESEKTAIIEEVKNIRQKVDNHFNKLENKLKESIEQESVIFKAAIDADVRKLEEAKLSLGDQKETLERLREDDNITTVFVQTKLANKCIVATEELEKLVEGTPEKNIYFLPNRELRGLLDMTSIGKLVESIPTCSADLFKVISVKTSKEKSAPTFSGVCCLEDGSALICDWQNENLVRLDENYSLTEHLDLPGQPYDICVIDSSTAAVTLSKLKEVHFVSTEKEMKTVSSFGTSDVCRGIAYSGGLIYIACGGWRIFKESAGHIEVYNTSGVLQTFHCSEHFSQLGHIGIAGSRLYVADSNNGLIIMDVNGLIDTIFTYKDMNNPLAVCAGPGNQIFLGGWSSHNVMLLSNEGQFLKLLLSPKNGIKNLHTLYFDRIRSRLICTVRDTYKIKIFDLTYY